MTKVIIYIVICLAILGGAGYYIESTTDKGELLSVDFTQSSNNEVDNSEQEENTSIEPTFKNLGQAPEFVGLSKWFNSDPKKMSDLRGKVVLIDFWTYSCINCIRTFPYVNGWYEKYKDQGLEIIGVHTPEFAFEKVAKNVETATTRYEIKHPVAMDNDYKTWNAYNNRFWPAHYLIDKEGNVVYTHFGEGKYEETEKAIRILLGLEGEFQSPPMPEVNKARTPEIYFGLTRLNALAGDEKASNNAQIYTLPNKLANNKFALEGNWIFDEESAIHKGKFGKIRLRFNAAKVFMVAESAEPANLSIYIDGKLHKGVVVKESELYPLYESVNGGWHTMDIEINTTDFKAFTFTFG